MMLIAGILLAAVIVPMLLSPSQRLVIYCAHDQALAEGVIERFEQKTGMSVDVRYDEEANKSLGLTQLLIAEKAAPRADVFWNNQLLGTVRLKGEGVLAPYKGTGWKRVPETFRDPDGYWTGFAARCRVLLVNTDQMPATEAAVHERLQQDSLRQCAIAEPLFGTTLSHYCVLAEQQGLEGLKSWHDDLRRRGVRVVRGNSMSKDLVAEGICYLGYTDTDDAFAAIDAGAPVEMLPVRIDNGATICLPNSAGMIARCRHPEAAQRFLDFLLSEESEVQLANGIGRQIPLGPVDESRLPTDLQPLCEWARNAVALGPAAEFHALVTEWLTAESTGQ